MARVTESETSFWDRAAETMPRGDLEQLQATQVRSCLERLKASRIERYRQRLFDVEPDEFSSPDDLRNLPFTVKDDLREHYPFGLFLVPRGEVVRIHASTGSTGKPTVVGYTRSDLELWADVLARGFLRRRAHDGEDGARDRGEDGGRGLRAVRPLGDHRPRRRVGLRSLRRDARLGGSLHT